MRASGSSEVGWRPIIGFLVVTFAWAWAWWFPMVLAGEVARAGQGWPTHVFGLLGPAVGAIVVTAIHDGRAGLDVLFGRIVRWRVAPRWWVLVAATGLLVLIPLFVGGGGPVANYVRYSGAPTIGLVTMVYALIINGFGEETGWRGFLAERLLKRTSLAVTSTIVWAIWATWHLPMFWVVGNFRDFGSVEIVGWLVGLLLGSVFLTWLYRSADHSILVVAVWHTTYNFSTATTATSGTAAAVASTIVMIAAVVVLMGRSAWRGGATPTRDARQGSTARLS